MIAGMTTPRRHQRTYDPRLRALVREAGGPGVVAGLRIPRSTVSGWLHSDPRPVVSIDVVQRIDTGLQREVLKLRRRIRTLQTLVRLLLAIVRLSGFRLDGERLPDGLDKARVLKAIGMAIGRARRALPLRAVLRVMVISAARYHVQGRQGASLLPVRHAGQEWPSRKACRSRPLSAGAIEDFVIERVREAAVDGALAADVERRLRARIEARRDELRTERRKLPGRIAKLSAEGRRLVEKIGEAKAAAGPLLDQRIAEIGDQIGLCEQRFAEVERALAAIDHAEVETKWVVRALADFDAVWELLMMENCARLVRALVRSVAVDEPSGAVTAVLAEIGLDDLGVEPVADDLASVGAHRNEPAPSEARA